MANDLTGNPKLVDTATTEVYDKPTFIKTIIWDGAANGNTLVIHHKAAGRVVFQAQWATGDPATVIYNINAHVHGVYVTTIGGGTALIYTD
tara:strand:+ start:1789 stop:2061 length:273 start_codon:yes stop_codon:yes gene_type:complete